MMLVMKYMPNKVYSLTPLLINNKDKWGLALDGQLNHEGTNLASSTLQVISNDDETTKEKNGVVVRYQVMVKLFIGCLGGDLVAELPFKLMHPKPPVEDDQPSSPLDSHKSEFSITKENEESTKTAVTEQKIETDTNLIQLEAADQDDDDDIIYDFDYFAKGTEEAAKAATEQKIVDFTHIDNANPDDDDVVFEDFARMRLKLDDDQDDIVFEDFARLRLKNL